VRILLTHPWETRSCREMSHGRIPPCFAKRTISLRVAKASGRPFTYEPPSWLTPPELIISTKIILKIQTFLISKFSKKRSQKNNFWKFWKPWNSQNAPEMSENLILDKYKKVIFTISKIWKVAKHFWNCGKITKIKKEKFCNFPLFVHNWIF